MVRHWNRLPNVVVDAPSLEAFKAMVDGQLVLCLSLRLLQHALFSALG